MSPFKQLLPLVASIFITSVASAQTWISELPEGQLSDPSVAVSGNGKIAMLRHRANDRHGVTVLEAAGSLADEFTIVPTAGSHGLYLEDVLFLDESTVAVCGELDGKPYAGAFNVNSGSPIWEKALTGDGRLLGLTLNSMGHLIGYGTSTKNGASDTLFCSMNRLTGGFQWFRSYNPGPSATLAQDVIALANGGMFFLVRGGDGLYVLRVTEFGHEVWSRRFDVPNAVVSKAGGCEGSDGGLVIALKYTAGTDTGIVAMSLDHSGMVAWSKHVGVPGTTGSEVDLGHVVGTHTDGSLLVSHTLIESGTPRRRSPGITRLLPNGQVAWTRNYGTPKEEGMVHIAPTFGGGFVGVYRQQWYSMRVFRTYSTGLAGPCQADTPHASTSDLQMAIQPYAYTYENYVGAIGAASTSRLGADSEVENVCRGDGSAGVPFCNPGRLNSTGVGTRLTRVFGIDTGSDVRLNVDQGPPGQFGYFLVGTHMASGGVPISQGLFCLSSAPDHRIGRYNVAGTNMNSVGQFDRFGNFVNLASTSATGYGFDVPILVPSIGGTIDGGETWHFQFWHREDGGESNFSNGLRVRF
ncbi:MAG: hypothetical protein P1V35_05160 [Planctomycetota bacterium]|nr:hypothetical protein [Planctomycetota bacterium]